jgi:hypothetical protein
MLCGLSYDDDDDDDDDDNDDDDDDDDNNDNNNNNNFKILFISTGPYPDIKSIHNLSHN